jgi:tetratricopeptide (TPR) repeat protein
MTFQLTCICGKVLHVGADDAGILVICRCGHTNRVPPLTALQALPISQGVSALPVPTSNMGPADKTLKDPEPGLVEATSGSPDDGSLTVAITSATPSMAERAIGSEWQVPDTSISHSVQSLEILDPMPAKLRSARGSRHVMVALTREAIWIQDAWPIRCVALNGLSVEKGSSAKELVLTPGLKGSAKKLMLVFSDAATGERWLRAVRRQQELEPGAPERICYRPAGVSFVRRAGDLPRVVMGRLEFTSQNRWAAQRGLQLRAGLRGADALIDVVHHKCPDMGWGAWQVTGTLVRLEDADVRKRMRLRFYGEQVRTLVQHMLALLTIEGVFLFLLAVFWTGPGSMRVPTGEKLPEALASGAVGLATVLVWPLFMITLLGILRWPGLLPATGLAVLASTTGWVIVVLAAHFTAVANTGGAGGTGISVLLDPFNWAFAIFGVRLWTRARYLARDARLILPEEMQATGPARVYWARSLFGASAVYGLALLGFAAFSRYQDSAYLLQPGIDVRREQEALLALNEGLGQFDRGDLAAAELSWLKSLKLLEQMTNAPSAPAAYQADLAQTLYNLGVVCDRQNRPEEAKKYYQRVVALAPLLQGDRKGITPEIRQTLANARRMVLAQQELEASQAFNEGMDQAARGDQASAEQSWTRSLNLYEELAKAAAVPAVHQANLALTCYNLGVLCERQNRREDAKKYYERVVTLAPVLEGAPQVMTPPIQNALANAQQALHDLSRGGPWKR